MHLDAAIVCIIVFGVAIHCRVGLAVRHDLDWHLDAVLDQELFHNLATTAREVEVLSLVHLPYADAKQLAIRAFERRYLSTLLEKHDGRIAQAARAAKLDRSNLRRLLKQFGVEVVRPDKEPVSAGVEFDT